MVYNTSSDTSAYGSDLGEDMLAAEPTILAHSAESAPWNGAVHHTPQYITRIKGGNHNIGIPRPLMIPSTSTAHRFCTMISERPELAPGVRHTMGMSNGQFISTRRLHGNYSTPRHPVPTRVTTG